MVNGITKEKEERALNIKHPGRKRTEREKGTEKGEIYTIFRDTEQIRDIPENEHMKYATIFQTGIRSVYKELHADHETGAADNK